MADFRTTVARGVYRTSPATASVSSRQASSAPLACAVQRSTRRWRLLRRSYRRGLSMRWSIFCLVFSCSLFPVTYFLGTPPWVALAWFLVLNVLMFWVPASRGKAKLERDWCFHRVKAARERLLRAVPASTRDLFESSSMTDQEIALGQIRGLLKHGTVGARVSDLIAACDAAGTDWISRGPRTRTAGRR